MKCTQRTRQEKSGTHSTQGKCRADIWLLPPSGYQKDGKDHNRLVIDKTAAPVVELIFSIAWEGVGLHTICNHLRRAKVIKPGFYKRNCLKDTWTGKMYNRNTAYVSRILHDPVYTEAGTL